MNLFRACYCRCFQKTMYVASFFLDFKRKETFEKEAGLEALIQKLKDLHFTHPFFIVDPGVIEAGSATPLLNRFSLSFPHMVIFDGVKPNPTFACVDDAMTKFIKHRCDCLIAIGGGSAIDLAKAAAIRLAYPNDSLSKFKGVLHVHRKLTTMIAIPTTAGTGSEATLAAVVVNEKTKDKFQIDDPKLRPDAILFYPRALTNLPPKVIAATGMDALTHAVECFIGKANTCKTKEDALLALRLIHDNLLRFYQNPHDENFAMEMLKGSYHAGLAFTRGYVGYVHALAHALGGEYNVAHGYANAVLLPIVLKAYGKSVYRKLAYLADEISLTPPHFGKEEKAKAFIAYIENLNANMGISRQFDHLIKEKDLDPLSIHAEKEGNPFYPVPKLFTKDELKKILRRSDLTWGVR